MDKDSWERINGKSYHLAYSSTSSITGTSTLGRSTGKVMMMSSAPVFSVMWLPFWVSVRNFSSELSVSYTHLTLPTKLEV